MTTTKADRVAAALTALKPGDRVRVLENPSYPTPHQGSLGVVSSVVSKFKYPITVLIFDRTGTKRGHVGYNASELEMVHDDD